MKHQEEKNEIYQKEKLKETTKKQENTKNIAKGYINSFKFLYNSFSFFIILFGFSFFDFSF